MTPQLQSPQSKARGVGATLALLGTLFLMAGCAGYHLGPTNHRTAGAQSIQINPFVNQTVEPRLTAALGNALRKALAVTYPNLSEMHLVDYKVRVINSAEGTAARVRVVIESRDHTDVWSTVGVSENVIEASWLALVDSVEYKLYKDAEMNSANV